MKGMYSVKCVPVLIFILWLGFCFGNVCSPDKNTNQPGTRGAVHARKTLLNVYTWVDYLDTGIISDFEKEFNVKVHVDVYDDEEEMFSSIQSDPGQYDVVFPTDYMADLMMKTNLLLKLDLSRIPNMRNIESRFKTLINKKWRGYFVTLD